MEAAFHTEISRSGAVCSRPFGQVALAGLDGSGQLALVRGRRRRRGRV